MPIQASTGASDSDRTKTINALDAWDDTRVKVHELWMDDGNIVLATQSSPHVFKFYRGLLARHSEVFRDMFALPRPKEIVDEKLYEGVPVVQLSDDWRDIEHLLRMFLDRKYFENTVADEKKVHTFLASLLKMSTKYQVPELRQDVIKELSSRYPCKLGCPCLQLKPKRYPSSSDIAAVIEASQESGVQILLPAAFCYLAVHPVKDIIPVLKTHEDIMKCLAGRDTLRRLRWKAFCKFVHEFPTDDESCLLSESCWTEIARIGTWDALFDQMVTSPAKFSGGHSEISGSLCKHCRNEVWQNLRATESDLWTQLPDIFGLNNWEELWNRSDIETGWVDSQEVHLIRDSYHDFEVEVMRYVRGENNYT